MAGLVPAIHDFPGSVEVVDARPKAGRDGIQHPGPFHMLEIRKLHVQIDDKKILNGLNLTVHDGEVAAIMGPNGSGKSTLSYVIAGKEDYEVLDGEILLNGENVL